MQMFRRRSKQSYKPRFEWRCAIPFALVATTSIVAGEPPCNPLPPCNAPACVEYFDPVGDAVLRRGTLVPSPDFPVAPGNVPDIISFRIGNFAPTDAQADLFDGEFVVFDAFNSINIDFVRFDIVFAGLLNPPGPIWGQPSPDPFRYGPSPLYGNIEFDIDNNTSSGGETAFDERYFLANYGRFGQLAPGEILANRTAKNFFEVNSGYSQPPQVERTGGEMYINLIGTNYVGPISVLVETGDPQIFEAGEVWEFESYFCRSSGYSFGPFWAGPQSGGAVYCPPTRFRFTHDCQADTTTVSMVAALINTNDPFGFTHDYDDLNTASINEGLSALQDATLVSFPTGFSEDEMIEAWTNQAPFMFFDSRLWDVRLLVGTTYQADPMSAINGLMEVWTDIPDNTPGDFTGDAIVDEADAAAFDEFLATYDGNDLHDIDGTVNGYFTIGDFPLNFSLYDINYDGIVEPWDFFRGLHGDLDGDGLRDGADIQAFADCLLLGLDGPTPDLRTEHNSACRAADMNDDYSVNAADIAIFVESLL